MQSIKNILVLLIGIVGFTPGNAQNGNAFKVPPYQKVVLKNGLTVYLMEQHEVPMITISAVLPAGAVYDGDQSGLATLTALALKHGSANMSKKQIDEALDFVGANISTYASKEYSGISAKFASKDKDAVLNILKEVMLNPSFDTTEFNKEKKRQLVSLEQAKESPGRVIGNYFDMLYYGDNVYANTTAGHTTTVAMLTANNAKQFYKTHYIPNGAAIAVAGDFNTASMKAQLTTLFNSWAKGTATPISASAISQPSAANVLLVNKDDATETTFYIGGPGIQYNNPDKVAINLVNTFFGGRFTSWLNDELRVNTGLTYGARSNFVPLKNAGTFRISTFTANKNTETAIDKAVEVLNNLHTNGVDATTLTSAKNYEKGQFPPDYETSGQLANLLTEMFWYGFNESYINNFEKNIDGLSIETANQVIKKYFPKENLQFVLIGKASEIRKIAEKYGKVKEIQLKDDTLKL